MDLQDCLDRLTAAVGELEKIAAHADNDVRARQIDLFGGAPRKLAADNTLVAKTLDRTIERVENLLKAGSR
ncbi:MAG: hypothetical protein H6865_07220 [Rhodospirillales bacterium]|nr:hypothetical protein [Alphaproteobacteria bacterium]MCB9987407.1 hypothetical protein [Rhodospirillales bacterium]USO07611.1 MAG: hypothetical protein H6866_09435 [Rhodospirillales bacterium]